LPVRTSKREVQKMLDNEDDIPHNIDLGKTQITDKIRVSSAALYRKEYFGSYWLVETWIFSDDPHQQNDQIIHGTCADYGSKHLRESLCSEARKIHGYIAGNLLRKFTRP
jgi:hypothetical protein